MEYYILTVQKFVKDITKEPYRIMTASILFAALSLPILSIGIAITFSLLYVKNSIEGSEFKLRNEFTSIIKKYGKRATLLWIIDLGAILCLIASAAMLMDTRVNLYIKLVYFMFFLCDAVFILTSLYQFPILIYNDISTKEIIAYSFALSGKNMPFTILIYGVICTWLIISVITSVGVLLIFPGGVLVLLFYAYKNLVKRMEVL